MRRTRYGYEECNGGKREEAGNQKTPRNAGKEKRNH